MATKPINYGPNIHGEGLNGGPGNITQQQVAPPMYWNGETPVLQGPAVLTAGQLKDIVNEMSDDQMWMDMVYNEEHPEAPRSDIQVGMFPNRPDRAYGSDYVWDTEAGDFLYNHPEYKGVQDYFADHGALDWLSERPLSDADKDAIARTMNLLQGINDYNRRQNLEATKNEIMQRNLYGDTLVDLLQNTPEGQSILGKAQKPKPMARERHISGPAQW